MYIPKDEKMRNFKQYLFVLSELVGRELKRKYVRSYLGVLWSVLNPLLSMVIMSLIFSTMFEGSIDNFPVYYLTGQIIWNMFTETTSLAMTALVDNKLIMIRTKLPRQIFPLSRILTSVVNFGYSLIAYVIIVVFFRISLSIHWLAFPIIVFLLLIFSTGFSYILTIMYTFMEDTKYLYSIVLTLWMYLSAIFYPVDGLNQMMQTVIECNPVYGYIVATRSIVMYHQWPTQTQWLQMMGWGVGMFLLGKVIFETNKNKIMIQNM